MCVLASSVSQKITLNLSSLTNLAYVYDLKKNNFQLAYAAWNFQKRDYDSSLNVFVSWNSTTLQNVKTVVVKTVSVECFVAAEMLRCLIICWFMALLLFRWLSWVQHRAVEYIYVHSTDKLQDMSAGAWCQVGPVHCEWVCFCRWRWYSVVLAAWWDAGSSNVACPWGSAAWWLAWNTPHGRCLLRSVHFLCLLIQTDTVLLNVDFSLNWPYCCLEFLAVSSVMPAVSTM